MVLCHGCTRNISTFYVELFVNKLLPLKRYKSSWFSVAAPHVPLQEEDLPLCKERCFLRHSLASACPFQLLLCALDGSVEHCSSDVSRRRDLFPKLLSPDCEKARFQCRLLTEKLKASFSTSSITTQMHLTAEKLQRSLWYCPLVTWFANDVTSFCLTLP